MLSNADLGRFAARFGVSDSQVRRDHLISHVLRALPSIGATDTHFFGGTALGRTFLEDERLSEDIDLLNLDFQGALEELVTRLPGALRREFPGSRIELGETEGLGRQAFLVTSDVPALKIYIGALHSERPSWQFQGTQVNLRYADLPPKFSLSCPSLATFAAMKHEAYYDRHAPRDLFDLAGVARIGAFSSEAEAILRAVKGVGFVRQEFLNVPRETQSAWNVELQHQVRELPSAESCRHTILAALDRA